jgi:hypothetical protein
MKVNTIIAQGYTIHKVSVDEKIISNPAVYN